MKRRMPSISALASALAALACAISTPASAGTVRFDGFAPSGSVSVNVVPPSVIGPTVSAGRYTGQLDGQSFLSYCIDLFATLSFGTTYTNEYVAKPAATYLNATRANDLARLAALAYDQVVDATTAAAFQVSVWEIAYETSGTYDVSGGNFSVTSGNGAVITDANNWLAALPGSAGNWQAVVLDSPLHQDVVTFSQTPVPGAAWLLGSGLLGLVAVRRRRGSGRR